MQGPEFSGACAELQKATLSFDLCLTVYPRVTFWLTLNGFLIIIRYFEYFPKLLENSNLIKI